MSFSTNDAFTPMAASYNSFSGVDIRVTFQGVEIGEIQGVSFTVTREKAPLYTMGNPNPRSFSRGKRGIAGSLIFLMFDRDAYIARMREANMAGFKAWPQETSELQKFAGDARDALNGIDVLNQIGRTIADTDAKGLNEPTDNLDRKLAKAWYADQMMPVDIVLTGENEYGASVRMAILGAEILNAGCGVSVDDISTDSNLTFVAREIVPWTPIRTTPELDAIRTLTDGQAGLAPAI